MPPAGPPPPPPPIPRPPAPVDFLVLDTPSALGPLVLSLRQARGLSQSELARQCGVGRRFIYDLERGKPTLRFDKVHTVLGALGVTLRAQAR